MSLILKGNLSFKLQTGATGPAPDRAYNLPRRSETWQGKQSDLDAFIAIHPLGSAHATWSWLKLEGYEPRYLEAGMVDVSLTYCGSTTGATEGKPSYNRLTKQQTITGKLWRTFERVVSSVSWVAGSTEENWGGIRQETEAETTYSVYVPAVTFRYARSVPVFEPQYAALAAITLANQLVSPVGSNTRQTGEVWTTVSGYPTGSNLAQYQIRRLVQGVQFADEVAPATVIRETDFSCEPIGGSGWYEIEETHEKGYDA